MLRKGLADDQVLQLHHLILEQHRVVKDELKKIPKDMMVLLKTAVVRSDMAQRRLLLENKYYPSKILSFQEFSPDGWNRYKSCLGATYDSLSPQDRCRTEGELQKAISLLELHQLAKAFIDAKRPVCDFLDDVSSHPQVLKEHSLRLSANGGSTSWEEMLGHFQENVNACSYKNVALQVEELCTNFGQCFSVAAGIDRGIDDKGVSENGEESHTGHGAAKNLVNNLFCDDSVSTKESCPHMGGPGLGSSSQCNTSHKDSESKYEQESEDDQESLGSDIPSTITLYERKSLDDNPKKRKGSPRCRFTEQEKQALIQGVHQFGEGKWSKIKAGSNGALSLRSAVQVKDLYRTMKMTNHAKASSPMFGAYK
jgi:hypothetical protein